MQRRPSRPPSACHEGSCDDQESEECDDSAAGPGRNNAHSNKQQQRHHHGGHSSPCKQTTVGGSVPQLGTPGPAAYSLPSCFKSRTPHNASSYILASNIAASIKSRNFAPGTDPLSAGASPGPQAYSPRAAAIGSRAGRAVFGSSHRLQEAKRYLGSEQLNKAAGCITSKSPGPGTYRVGYGRQPGLAAPGPCSAPRAAFPPQRARASPALSNLRRALSLSALHATSRPGTQGPKQQDHPVRLPAHVLAAFHSCSSTPRRAAATHAVHATWGSGSSGSTGGGGCTATTSSSSSNSNSAGAAGSRSPPRSPQHLQVKNEGRKWSFGPAGGPQMGLERRRSKDGNLFISEGHAAVDPGRQAAAAASPGAAAYDVDGKLALLSTHRSAGAAAIGSEKKGAKLYLSRQHVKSDPTLTESPGPGTATWQLPGCLGAAASPAVPLSGPRFGPSRSRTAKQPFISKQHDIVNRGNDSPGPACYDAAAAAAGGSVLGDRRTAHFGTGERSVSAAVQRTFAPGPGAYATDLLKLSTHASPPAYSLGASLPTASWARGAPDTPGPAQYDVQPGSALCLHCDSAPVSIKGKLQHGGISGPSCSPGPQAYSPGLGMGSEAEEAWQQRWGSRSSSRGNVSSAGGSQGCTGQGSSGNRSSSPVRLGMKTAAAAAAASSPCSPSLPAGNSCAAVFAAGSSGALALTDMQHGSAGRSGSSSSSGRPPESVSTSAESCCKSMRWAPGTTSSPGAAAGNSSINSCSTKSPGQAPLGRAAWPQGLFLRTTTGILDAPADQGGHEFARADDDDAGDAFGGSSGSCSRLGSPQRRGFSIQGKDSSPASSGIHRDSPGPAAYEVNTAPTTRFAGSLKLNSRAAPPRQFISKPHAESQAGVDLPAPAAYSSSGAGCRVLSAHAHTGAFSFGAGRHTEMAKIKF